MALPTSTHTTSPLEQKCLKTNLWATSMKTQTTLLGRCRTRTSKVIRFITRMMEGRSSSLKEQRPTGRSLIITQTSTILMLIRTILLEGPLLLQHCIRSRVGFTIRRVAWPPTMLARSLTFQRSTSQPKTRLSQVSMSINSSKWR